MRFLRHKNGGGKISDDSECCPLSTLNRDSQISGKSSVWSSHITDSGISKSTITGAIIQNSGVSKTIITGGKISDSIIECELIADFVLIENSGVFGHSRVAHTAHVENTYFENLTVFGDAHLLDWRDEHILFNGHGGYISRGVWTRPPKILYLEKDLTITESVPGFAFVGCSERSIKDWLKVGDRYGKRLGLTPDDVQQIREFLLTL